MYIYIYIDIYIYITKCYVKVLTFTLLRLSFVSLYNTEAYLELCQKSLMRRFYKNR